VYGAVVCSYDAVSLFYLELYVKLSIYLSIITVVIDSYVFVHRRPTNKFLALCSLVLSLILLSFIILSFTLSMDILSLRSYLDICKVICICIRPKPVPEHVNDEYLLAKMRQRVPGCNSTAIDSWRRTHFRKGP
jgi:hypothetical protein